MQGHLPGPPQPHFPDGLAPFVGYIATREPRPLDERVLVEPGITDDGGDPTLDEFDDPGDWQPIHRPFFKATAVIVALSLMLAGLSTVIELVLAGR
jgi:hypothetical protein